ncbi:hypothetical protein F2Q68_00009155 [Brassica cretica]|uniref:Uncharacterized protein n=1 Tax=Brassica cretica TaxID=69181 RepID=A0A8S9KU78_BRACR|nr:hypothetical protein F2Q68_00009155 [Brassica cretica]
MAKFASIIALLFAALVLFAALGEYMYLQKHQQWWKHRSCARGQVGHGQESVETITHARISALTLRKHDMDLATMSSQLTSVFATSLVNLCANSLVVVLIDSSLGGSCRRFFSSVALLADARWLPSTNFGGYRRRIKSVALPDDEKRRLLLIAIERLRLLFQIVRKTFVVSEGIKKEPKQVPGDILSFFTRKNFNGTDRGETITNNGFEERTSCSAHVLYMYKLLCSCSEVSDGCVSNKWKLWLEFRYMSSLCDAL